MPRPQPIRWLREHPRGADLLLAALITVVALTAHLTNDAHRTDQDVLAPTWWSPFLVVLTAAPTYWRREFPLRAGVVVVAAECTALLLGVYGAPFLGATVGVYSIGAHASGPRRARVLAVVVALVVGLFVAGWIDGQDLLGEFVSTSVFLVTAFVLGDNMRRRRERADSLAERAERAERERELLAEQRVNAERTRIARELHDVVAHSVSVMIIQAAAARRNLTSSPPQAEQALAAIEDTGRQTMHELRSILGVLRADADDVGRDPQPTLSDLDALLRDAEDIPVELTIDDVGELPPGVELTAYRVAQEAITNVRRHAGPVEHVAVRVTREHGRLVIAVDDDGRGAAADRSDPGFGLVGMRERVAAMGGSVAAGPRGGGGWRVRVTLPIDPGRVTGEPDAARAVRSGERA